MLETNTKPGRVVLLLATFVWIAIAQGQPPENAEQKDRPQCAHWVVFRCCELQGVPIEMREIMSLLPSSPKGHSFLDVAAVLDKIGLKSQGRQMTYDAFAKMQGLAIAHMRDPDHFVLVDRKDNDAVAIFDGEGFRRMVARKDFLKRWSGNVLCVWKPRGSQVLPSFTARGNGSGGQIRFDTLLIDRGETPSTGEPIVFEFPFANVGKGELKIEKVRTDCRCMGSEDSSKSVPPGQQGKIVLKYKDERGGTFQHAAYVHTNDPTFPIIRLTAAGFTSDKVRASPPYLDLGRIPCGREKVSSCYVACAGNTLLKIDRVTSSDARIHTEFFPLTKEYFAKTYPELGGRFRYFPKNTYVIQVRVKGDDRDHEELKGTLSVSTNIKGFEKVNIPLHGELLPPS